ncbi:hypothetical protein PV08_08373 [Exophiala spinifera]|uniref:Major facilitator superfamily (MFS) profile domain-containing protein n=1 Tax=Exophiala spinifera TaxID=91928 RepID=A0A0D1YDR4_9EURO|nr:uncharacterized protein PV08_08373 [Exophiala spinifera]KIW13186.1 hypothetical protein PV08_08373 [Exophiala spinifera]
MTQETKRLTEPDPILTGILTSPASEKGNENNNEQTSVPISQRQRDPEIERANTISGPPDGGLQAWLQVVGGFMLFFNTWGLLNTFAVYQTYYESGALFTKSSSDISWIGSLQSFLLPLVGAVAGPIYDRGYLRPLLVVGSFLVVFGHMMLSLCNSYWEVILAQGFCIGIGAGCLFVPCVAVLPQWFSSRLGMALGLAVAGSSSGGIIYPIVLYRLVDQIGFGWSVRVLGFLALCTLLFPVFLLKMRVIPPKARAIIDWSAFVDVQFMYFVVALLIAYMGLIVTIFYPPFSGLDRHILDDRMAFYVVPIFNAGSCFGRTIPNILSDSLGPLNLLVPGVLMVGVLLFCMIAATTEGSLIVVIILLGFFSGVIIGLPPLVFVSLAKDKSKIGTRVGMGFSLASVGFLAGGPGGGNILGQNEPLDWTGLYVYGGVVCCVAAVMLTGLRCYRTGFQVFVKA